MLKKRLVISGMTLPGSLAAATPAAQYQVTITNITPGQSFTPQLVVTQRGNVRLFRLGEPAWVALEQLAEGGDTGPLGDALANVATDLQTNAVLLGPGETTSVAISGHPARGYISIAAMLIPTNDTFVDLNRVALPTAGAIVQLVPACDAGACTPCGHCTRRSSAAPPQACCPHSICRSPACTRRPTSSCSISLRVCSSPPPAPRPPPPRPASDRGGGRDGALEAVSGKQPRPQRAVGRCRSGTRRCPRRAAGWFTLAALPVPRSAAAAATVPTA